MGVEHRRVLADGTVAPRQVVTPRGDPISMKVSEADLHDLLRTFARMADLEAEIDPRLAGSVTLDLREVTFEEALQHVADEHGFVWRIDGGRLVVERQ